MKTLLDILNQRIQEIAGDTAPTSFDLDRYLHAWGETDPFVLDTHLTGWKPHPSYKRKSQFFIPVLDRVIRNGHDLAEQVSVSRVRKRFDFDDSVLTDVDKANVLVFNVGFNFDGIVGNNFHQRLSGCDNATERMCRQLLYRSRHR
ncbi:hypothetical protein WJ78_17310 [Burkholderia ubonensis]|nr:hypothetical protein WI84_14350 [Burkholderia ubonensis]KVD78488.1 hypothetical protein WI89_30645 [Burkholderia ubonensis]KVO64888.1 hypothetical protein WJ78_17310 [Burkholderia ubonensis]KVP89886.1 hypothetical protein WJ97_23100 [Burkholderia ubonensis]KVQ08344.1 hypothetical protein WJ99_23250 [Burkholderia ubonensis]